MKFERYARYDKITVTQRKVAALARKQQNERARYPLFADHVASEQPTVDAVMTRRSNAWEAIEVSMRAHHAKTWRASRARYFTLTEDVKQQIRDKWNSWVGPRTPSYYAWVVDTLSGDQAARIERCKNERREVRASLPKSVYTETADLFC